MNKLVFDYAWKEGLSVLKPNYRLQRDIFVIWTIVRMQLLRPEPCREFWYACIAGGLEKQTHSDRKLHEIKYQGWGIHVVPTGIRERYAIHGSFLTEKKNSKKTKKSI